MSPRRLVAGIVVCLAFACGGDLTGTGTGRTGGDDEGDGSDAGPAEPMRLRVTGTGTDGARLREAPGDGNTIVRIPDGCLIDPTGPPDLGWLPVRWREYEGWVYGAFVEHAEPDAPDCP